MMVNIVSPECGIILCEINASANKAVITKNPKPIPPTTMGVHSLWQRYPATNANRLMGNINTSIN